MSDVITPFGLTLLVDKPLTWTSFDVVNKLRYHTKKLMGVKKVKVGHAGTLDPLATGLVIICIGSHTKKINELTGMDKTYEGTMVIGATTPSYDLETEINHHFDIPAFDKELLERTARSFLGESDQVPPLFSAKKINGKKAYDLARAGKSTEMKPSRIRIDAIELAYDDYPEIHFRLQCSKGTYVRSLANDFGSRIGSGAYLKHLRRTGVGTFSIADALGLDEAIEGISKAYDKYLESN